MNEDVQVRHARAYAEHFGDMPMVTASIARQVVARAGETAVCDTGGASLSYAELWERSGWTAAALAEAGVAAGDRVALALGRSVDWVVAALGVLRAGAAYVPLDPRAPEQRLRVILEESAPRAVVEDAGTEWESPHGRPRVTVPTAEPHGTPVPLTAVDAESALFVGFTSGSTGRPKGVVISHRAVASFTDSPEFCPMGPGDRLAGVSSPLFDLTTFDVWNTLVAGATLVVFPHPMDIPVRDWDRLLRAHRITVLCMTTALFDMVAREEPAAFRSLDTLMFGGEAVDAHVVRRVCAGEPPRRLVNVYGPTEATTIATAFECTAESVADAARIPIGFAVRENTLHVLDEHARPVPEGDSGELCIGGPQLASGYLGSPELTAQKFIALPDGELVYRTGDLVRALPDGALEFLGRIDRQVKLRGFRIELEEIEFAAMATGWCASAVVEKTGQGGTAQLIGFVQPAGPDAAPPDELADRLAEAVRAAVPDYMAPARWLVVAEMPLSVSGKIDRDRLVAMAEEQRTGTANATADGPLAVLCAVVAELLSLADVRPDDNFLDLGGNSILALQASARLRERLGVDLNPADLLFADTLAELDDLLAADPMAADPMADGPSADGLPADGPSVIGSAADGLSAGDAAGQPA